MARPLHSDPNRFGTSVRADRAVDDRHIPDCRWDDCRNPQMSDEILVCEFHAVMTHLRIVDMIEGPRTSGLRTDATPLVYYLQLAPTTVKIGTTGNLVNRVASLRSEMQYVIAVEPGSYEVEHKRHKAFDAERLGRREDFRLSPRLSAHIERLRAQTYSDELLIMYNDLAQRRSRALA